MSLGSTQWYHTLFYSHLWFSIVQTQLHFICLTGNFRKGVVRLNWVAKWVGAWKRLKTTGLEVLRIFTRKMLVSQLYIWGVCCYHALINLFWLRKILIVLFITKQYQPFCVRTGGDALVKVPCSGLLYWSRPMLFDEVEKRIITLYFKTSIVDVGECIQPQ